MTSVHPDAVIKAYPNIRQDNGDPTYQTAQVNDGWLMFNADFDHMEAFFKYYDWLYDVAFGTVFDKFVEDWKAQGGEQITQEVNEWYQSVKKKIYFKNKRLL